MTKDDKYFMYQIMACVPWGIVLAFTPGPTVVWQLCGIAVQLIGLTFLITRSRWRYE